MNRLRTVVLDTSAFIAGFDPAAVGDDLYSVPAVEEELTAQSLSRLRFDAAVQRGRLKIREPSSKYLAMVKKSSTESGDMRFLSEADLQILGLAMELRAGGHAPTIVTDDYSIQNVAKKIGVDFTPLVTFGIRYYLHWLLYCPACRKKYPSDYESKSCEICGTQLKRKPLSKRPVTEEGEAE